MIFFEKKNTKGEIIATNITEGVPPDAKSKNFYRESGILTICSDEKDLLNSAKTFKKVGEVCASAFDLIYKNFIELVKAHSHTLRKIQGQLIQKIEGVVQPPILFPNNTYLDQKNLVLDKITREPEYVADTILYLQRRIVDLGAHMAGFEIIHMGENIELDIRPHNLKKMIFNIWYAFGDIFEELNIRPVFHFTDDQAEVNKLNLDYKIINAALYNFFDNLTKYSKPYSIVNFYLNINEAHTFDLIITTKSLRIERDEHEKIFEFGIRGKNSLTIDGMGVGMYVVKKALQLNRLVIKAYSEYADSEWHNDQQYILNNFTISGRL